MGEVSSRSSLQRFVKKSLTRTEGCGLRTRRMSCIPILTPTQRKVCSPVSSRIISDYFIAHSLNWYRFIGRVLGKAMYEGILVDVAFAGFFLAKASSIVIDLSPS